MVILYVVLCWLLFSVALGVVGLLIAPFRKKRPADYTQSKVGFTDD